MMFFFFRFFSFQSTGNEVKCWIAQHSMQVQIQYTQFLAANCRCEKLHWLVLLGSRRSSSFAELKVMNMLRTLLVLKHLLLYLFLAPLAQYDEDLTSDYLTCKQNPNKINTKCLCLSYGSTKLLLLYIELEMALRSTSFDFFPNFSEELSRKDKMVQS